MKHLSIMVNRSLTNTSGSFINPGYEYSSIFYAITILVSSLGILGNGMVIWLLVFWVKKNPFTTYILNLAIADFGFLTTSMISAIIFFLPLTLPSWYILHTLIVLFRITHFSQYSTSQYLLTVISVDRCVSVFFPIWHRCHRPKHMSAIVCALMWLLSFLPNGACLIRLSTCDFYYVLILQLTVNGLLCLPLMIIPSLMIFIKVCCKSEQRSRRKLLITIMITVSFFFLFCLPINCIYVIDYFFWRRSIVFYLSAMLCACLNSSVNPLIYYLVNRPWKERSDKSMKAVLQKLFKEEEV